MRRVTPQAMEILMEREYPGNVRELKNLITRAVTFADGDMITPGLVDRSKKGRISKKMADFDAVTLKERVEELEKKMVKAELTKQRWNKSKTARALGLTRRGLENKIKRYNLVKVQL